MCPRAATIRWKPAHRSGRAGLFPLSIQTLRGAFHRRGDPFVGADKPAEQKQNVDSDPDDDAEIQYEKKGAHIWHDMVGFDVTLTRFVSR